MCPSDGIPLSDEKKDCTSKLNEGNKCFIFFFYFTFSVSLDDSLKWLWTKPINEKTKQKNLKNATLNDSFRYYYHYIHIEENPLFEFPPQYALFLKCFICSMLRPPGPRLTFILCECMNIILSFSEHSCRWSGVRLELHDLLYIATVIMLDWYNIYIL